MLSELLHHPHLSDWLGCTSLIWNKSRTLRATLAQYWGRPRILPGLLMPALLLTKHWLGMPKKESLARLTSWYSSAPAAATCKPGMCMQTP